MKNWSAIVRTAEVIAIFSDYTAKVAKAWAAFADVKKLLQDQQGVRYGILFPTRLHITYNGIEKDFVEPDIALDVLRKHIVTSPEGAVWLATDMITVLYWTFWWYGI